MVAIANELEQVAPDSAMSAFTIAIGGKADMACCSAYVCF